ncbi:MAG: polyribonucleotide nucleotidyltransferase [Candidatus Binatia bacterium]
MRHEVALEIGGRRLSLETGRIAKQADGAVVVSYNDTTVLVTAVSARSMREGQDFFPLTVEYQEKAFAAGKIPGGFFKREGRLSADEVLVCRCIDRPMRPLFPEGYMYETQIIATVLSADRAGLPDVISLIGASAAVHVSNIPFDGPIAGVRVGRLGGKLVANPTMDDLETSDINLLIAAKRDSIVMVEGGGNQVPEDELLEALYFGHDQILPIIALQDELRALSGNKAKREFVPPSISDDVLARVRELAEPHLRKAYSFTEKMERYANLDKAKAEFKASVPDDLAAHGSEVSRAYSRVKEDIVRGDIVAKGHRVDGRSLDVVRPIDIETSILPRCHGSTLFTRGETQAIVVATLGTSADTQRIDALLGDVRKRFMLHYNFPPYSVGEAKMLRSAGRREVGHGALAERAILPVLPSADDFPYTLRIVSEVTESNGSSSMATVCGASLSLMDAGVPIKASVAGVAMGLIAEDGKFSVLTDILGDEDHLGDMDFKVAGTKTGVTAVQMDIKISGIPREVMRDALYKARTARLHILSEMEKALAAPRGEMSQHAPRIETIRIHIDKIRDLIGPGGKVIRGIVEQTGCKVDVSDDGTVLVASSDGVAMRKALDIIAGICASPEVGRIYNGTVRRIADFGAFVEILPGTDGLLHVSQIDEKRVENVRDFLKEGDKIPVKVLEVDRQGKIRLSLKEAKRELAEKESA